MDQRLDRVLSGPGLAMPLVLLAELGGRDPTASCARRPRPDRELWFSPGMAKRRYDLSEDTRAAGVRELADAGLVSITRRDTNFRPVRRRRNVYRLHTDKFAAPAEIRLAGGEAA